MDSDELCAYQPQGLAVIEPLSISPQTITWSIEAQQRLNRIPGFVRKLVKKRAEVYVLELGESQVTGDHLATLSAMRFGDRPPTRPDHVR